MTVRTRFAPSPTGVLHVGGARTALFCWLYARHYQGQFILRIEDTDRERSTEASVHSILDALAWLGIAYDEGPFFQSERIKRYTEIARRLLESGNAYYCYCTREELDNLRAEQLKKKQKPRYDGRCRDRREPRSGVDPVLRFKNPLTGTVVMNDLVHGEVCINNDELDDLILLRSDGSPTYNLTVVVDDMDMNISHVMRGEDHLNNTPRQINLLKALDAPIPTYAHLPMILDVDGKRLSKRTGASDVAQYKQAGYLPAAVLNYLVRLGWSHQSQEVFSVNEMIEFFDGKNIGVSAASLNPEKLDWLNQTYLQTDNADGILPVFAEHLSAAGYNPDNGPDLSRTFDILRSRYKNLSEMAAGAAFLYQEIKDYDIKLARKYLIPENLNTLKQLKEQLTDLEPWEADAIKQAMNDVCGKLDIKMKNLGPPFRFALTNGAPSPDLALTAELIKKQQCLERLQKALKVTADAAR